MENHIKMNKINQKLQSKDKLIANLKSKIQNLETENNIMKESMDKLSFQLSRIMIKNWDYIKENEKLKSENDEVRYEKLSLIHMWIQTNETKETFSEKKQNEETEQINSRTDEELDDF